MRVERKNARDDEMVDRRRRDDPVNGATTLELRVVVDEATPLPTGKGPDHYARLAARRAYLRLIARRLRNDPASKAFTLVELLVVIAVIAMLAGLLVGVLPGALEKRTSARVETELHALVMAIEYYKDKQGFYPPDNPNNAAEPPLYYELVGTTNNGASYYSPNGDPSLSGAAINTAFGPTPLGPYNGFLNSGEPGEVKNFYPTLRGNQYNWSPFPKSIPVRVLTVPAKGPKYPGNPGTEATNTWRYVVAKTEPPQPVHNPTTFDLWAEVISRGRTNVIGNWRRK